ncbi:MAG: response regulator [Actinomycetes bacterium]
MSAPPMDDTQVRVVLADNNAELLRAVSEVLAAAGMTVVASAATGDEAVAAVGTHDPDVIVLDVLMPGGGAELVRQVAARSPRVRMMALTASDDEETALEMLAAGVTGFVSKAVLDEDLATCVRRCAEGMLFVVAGCADRVRERLAQLWLAGREA